MSACSAIQRHFAIFKRPFDLRLGEEFQANVFQVSFTCPRFKLEELFSREAPSKATSREESTVSSSTFPAANIITTMSNLAVKALVRLLVNLWTKQYPTSPFAPLSEKCGL